jgi:hypothetical protein
MQVPASLPPTVAPYIRAHAAVWSQPVRRHPRPCVLFAEALEASSLIRMGVWRSARGALWACPLDEIPPDIPVQAPDWPLRERRRHYKGGICVVLHRDCRLVRRPGLHVLYRGPDGTHWLRPRSDFEGEAFPGILRFAPLT